MQYVFLCFFRPATHGACATQLRAASVCVLHPGVGQQDYSSSGGWALRPHDDEADDNLHFQEADQDRGERPTLRDWRLLCEAWQCHHEPEFQGRSSGGKYYYIHRLNSVST